MADSVLNSPATPKTYKVGVLTYTKMGVVKVIFWLILGHTFFILMQTVLFSLIPLKVKDIGVSDFGVNLIAGTIPSVMGYIMGFLIGPIISFKSDRHRGKRGRRIPFLLWPIPFIGLFLILTGHAPAMGSWIALHLNISKAGVMIGLTAVCMACFTFLTGFVSSIFFLLIADVVPGEYMGRFMAVFMVLGSVSGLIWNVYIYGTAFKHMTAIVSGLAFFPLPGSSPCACASRKAGTPRRRTSRMAAGSPA